MGRKCEFGLCPNKVGDSSGKTYHSFPKLHEDCALWVQFCCSEALVETFSAGGVAAVRQRRIGSVNFMPEAYKNPLQPEKGLRPNAVPTVGESYYELMVSESSIISSNSTTDQLEKTPITTLSEPGLDNRNTEVSDSRIFIERSIQTASSQDEEIVYIPDLAEAPASFEFVHMVDFQNDDNSDINYKQMYLTEKRKRLRSDSENQTFEKKLRPSDRKRKWRWLSNIGKKKKHRLLRAELKQEQRSNDELKRLGNLFKSNRVLHNSLINESKKPQGRRYNKETKKFAVGTYLAGPSRK